MEDFKEPHGPDQMYVKCKTDDKLLILDQDMVDLSAEDVTKGERVLITFKIENWVLPKKKHEDFLFKLLCIRVLPTGGELESEVYVGPVLS